MSVLVDNYSEGNSDGYTFVYSPTRIGVGQSFIGNGTTINSTKFHIYKTGSPSGNIVSRVYLHSGTFGTSSLPTGSPIATSEIVDASTLSTSAELVEFTFTGSNKILLGNGTYYVVTIEFLSGDSTNYICVSNDTSSPTHEGNFIWYDGGWSYSYPLGVSDLVFYVYGDISPSLPNVSLYPNTVSEDNIIGSYGWSSLDFAKTSNNQYAYSGLMLTQPGNNCVENSIRLIKDGVISGEEKSIGAMLPTSDTFLSYGNSDDTWGLTLSPDDINSSDFGLAISFRGIIDDRTSYYLKLTDFGFNVPSGSIIVGVLAEVECKYVVGGTNVVVDTVKITIYYSSTISNIYSITGVQSITF